MIKRPLHPRFTPAVLSGRKTTTIRDKPWPLATPIMLYNWSGAAYRSLQVNVAPILVTTVNRVHISRHLDGTMLYAYNRNADNQATSLWETEGFDTRLDMDLWFSALLKPGQSVTKSLMRFHLKTT